jgi:hypothetical protein
MLLNKDLETSYIDDFCKKLQEIVVENNWVIFMVFNMVITIVSVWESYEFVSLLIVCLYGDYYHNEWIKYGYAKLSTC